MNERQIPLLENERIDDLNLKGLKIIQQTNGFCFTVKFHKSKTEFCRC